MDSGKNTTTEALSIGKIKIVPSGEIIPFPPHKVPNLIHRHKMQRIIVSHTLVSAYLLRLIQIKEGKKQKGGKLTKNPKKKNITMVKPFTMFGGMSMVFKAIPSRQPLCDGLGEVKYEGFYSTI